MGLEPPRATSLIFCRQRRAVNASCIALEILLQENGITVISAFSVVTVFSASLCADSIPEQLETAASSSALSTARFDCGRSPWLSPSTVSAGINSQSRPFDPSLRFLSFAFTLLAASFNFLRITRSPSLFLTVLPAALDLSRLNVLPRRPPSKTSVPLLHLCNTKLHSFSCFDTNIYPLSHLVALSLSGMILSPSVAGL